MTTITFEQALEGLLKAVEIRGADFVYPKEWREGEAVQQCVNFLPNGDPACIAGMVYAQQGVSVEEEPAWRSSSVADLHSEGWLWADDPTVLLLDRAQNEQDSGSTWGDAVIQALLAVQQQYPGVVADAMITGVRERLSA